MAGPVQPARPMPKQKKTQPGTVQISRFEEAAAKMRLKDVVITTISAALGFVAALTWNNAIQNTIIAIVPEGSGLEYEYLAAIIVTLVAAVFVYLLYRLQKSSIESIFNTQKKKA